MSQKIPDAPITRSEQYDAREIELLEQIAEGGLGPSVTVEPLPVTANGTYTAPTNTAFSPVTVAVPEPVLDELEVTQNGTYTPVHDGYSEVTVNVPTGGGGGEPTRDVNFYDYDGTVLYSYSAADFLALTAMPANPSHDGLTAQGWNWSLADAQEYVGKYGMLEIGQMYITDDGKTRIYIHLEEGRLSPYLGICPNGSVDIDWGDGSAHDTVTGTSVSTFKAVQHTYAAAGDYVIKLTVTGEMRISGDSINGSSLLTVGGAAGESLNKKAVYLSAIRKIELGENMAVDSGSFCYCRNLESIVIPANIKVPYAARSVIPQGFLNKCVSLRFAVIPDGTKALYDGAFEDCGLASVSVPNSVTEIRNRAFYNCKGLTAFAFPEAVETPQGLAYCQAMVRVIMNDNADSIGSFQYLQSLSAITIPAGITEIPNNTFSYCYGIGSIRFTALTPPVLGGSNVFYVLPTDCIIYVPTGTLSAYTTATNYPSASTYTYVEY